MSNNTHWTEEEEDELARDFARLGAKGVARKTGRSYKSVVAKAHRLRLSTAAHWSAEEEEAMLRDYAALGPTALAERLGRTPRAVIGKAQALGVTCRGVQAPVASRLEGRYLPSEAAIRRRAAKLRVRRGPGWEGTR
jgi:hypothetical protein